MGHEPTVLHRLKRFPTYQFHAEITSDQLSESEVFLRLILETFSWLRARLNGDIPAELQTPEPEEYALFSEAQLSSFTLDQGWKADVTYVPEKGVWAFSLRETDMGANIGRENERPPVQGRLFTTDISFIKCGRIVECGVRTIVTEPVSCDAPCEVFRPAVVRSIIVNPQFRLSHRGIMLDAKPFYIDTKADAERFAVAFQNQRFDYPLILIADAGFEDGKQTTVPTELPKINRLSLSFSSTPADYASPKVLLADGKSKPFITSEKPKSDAKPSALPIMVTKKPPVRRVEFPYERLADKLKGYGIVCYASDKVFSVLNNKLHLNPKPGDIIISVRGQELERLCYSTYSKDMETCYQKLKLDIQKLPKRRAYDFGKVIFQADAHLIALQERREAAQTMEESCALYQQENAELKARLSELEQQDNDLRERSEMLRLTKKQLQAARDENSELLDYIEKLQAEFQARQVAYEKASGLVQFYKDKAEIAANFPTDKDDICDWAEAQFPETLVITQRARTELRKYQGGLDVSLLCDGLLYLDAYSRARNGKMTEEQLALYTDQRNWEVSFSGKEAVRLHESDYTVSHEGKKYKLDMHIKYGNRATNLIRIYFCRDVDTGRIIVGSMPEHLATASQST